MPGLKRAKPLFKRTDFESHQCVVVMRNITTSTELKKGLFAELSEADRSSVSLVLPEGVCAEGHLLLLRFFDEQAFLKVKNSPRSVQDKSQLLAVTGRVVRVETTSSKKFVVTVELQQYVEKEWLSLLKGFREAQEKISALVKKVKQ